MLLRLLKLTLLSMIAWQPMPVLAQDEANSEESEQTEAIPSEANAPETAPPETGASETEPPTKVVVERYLPQLNHKQGKAVQHHMDLFNRSEEVLKLRYGNDDFFGLYLQERTGAPNGAILILHDKQQHGHWPASVAPLREYLPDYGWTTLTIELPDAPDAEIPQRIFNNSGALTTTSSEATGTTEGEAAPENTDTPPATAESVADVATEDNENIESEPADNAGPDTGGEEVADANITEPNGDNALDANTPEPALPRLQALPELESADNGQIQAPTDLAQTDAMQAYIEQGRNRILAAIDYLQQQGQLNLAIVGWGEGAAWAVDYGASFSQGLENPEDGKGLVLITINPMNSPRIPLDLEQSMTDVSIPFLELLTPTPNSPNKVKAKAKRRLGKMKHALRKGYQQIRIANMPYNSSPENPATRRVRGWLKSNAAGTQVQFKD